MNKLLFLTLLGTVLNPVLAQDQEAKAASGGWNVADSKESIEANTSLENRVEDAAEPSVATTDTQQVSVQDTTELKKVDAQGERVTGEKLNVDSNSVSVNTDPMPLDALSSRQPDTLIETGPAPEIAPRPILDIDEDLRRQLETQFKTIQELRDTEDAFSERLGESFFSYGDALQRAGRLEEARDMFAQALHLNKVNNGVNNIAQRPILKSLAWIELAEGDTEKAEEYVGRMIWVEKQQREVRDTYSYDVILALGNKILDQYLYRPVAGESSLALLDSASKYFRYVLRRYGDQPIDKLFMPYGELAYVQHLKLALAPRVDSSFYRSAQRDQNRTGFPSLDRRLPPVRQQTVTRSLGSGETFIRQYMAKAARSGSAEHKVQALLNMGDVHQLFGRSAIASRFYEQAWIEAQALDENHELVIGMSKPHKLPAFFYASDRNNDEVATYTPKANVPLDISVTSEGFVDKVYTVANETDTPKLTQRARRSVKRIKFRPAIEAGKLVGTDRYTESVRVTVRKSDNAASDSSGN